MRFKLGQLLQPIACLEACRASWSSVQPAKLHEAQLCSGMPSALADVKTEGLPCILLLHTWQNENALDLHSLCKMGKLLVHLGNGASRDVLQSMRRSGLFVHLLCGGACIQQPVLVSLVQE